MPYSLKFVILLIKLLSNLSILLSSIPIYLIYVLLGENPLSNSQNLHFTEKCSTDNLLCKIQWLYNSPFRKIKVIKFFDLVSIGNCIFIKKWTFCKSYSVFSHLYNLATGRHNHRTGYALNGLLILLNFNTVKFGTKAFLYFTIASSSSFQASFSEKDFRILSLISLKKLLKDYFISLYFEEIPFLCFCMCIYIV